MKTNVPIVGDTENTLASFLNFFLSQSVISDHCSEKGAFADEKELSRFKKLFKETPVRIAIFDTEMRYIVASDRFLEESQSVTKDVVGKCHYDVVPDIPQRWRKLHARVLKGESFKRDEERFDRADGRVEWLKWELSPWYKSEGVVGGVILFLEYFSERKELELKMQKVIQTLNRSNEYLERFAHICAHDLNEPLRTIGSYCQLLAEDFGQDLPEQAQMYLKNITNGVKQMGEMVTGILMYSQLDTPEISDKKCSAQQIMDSVRMILAQKIKDTGAKIQYGALPDVYGDQALLTRVFQNLVSNALKFNKSDVPMVTVTATEGKKYVTFCVEDNGIGIDRKYHKVIFDLFKRLHTAREYVGTGIGLSLCKKIIEACGGKIRVESSLAGGAKFLFSLPKKPYSSQIR